MSVTPSASPTPSVLAVIPARYASSRFPGKPLALIQGKPMIQRVWEQVQRVAAIKAVVIATDDERIQSTAQAFGADVRMTSPDHPSGTDRMQEVASQFPEYDWILNVQGDEPFIDPQHLAMAIAAIDQHPAADIITLVTPIMETTAWHEPNIVKAVLSNEGKALYFSRASIPYHRDHPQQAQHAFRHLGVYLYRREALEQFTRLSPSPLEQIEKLEQLRALEAGLSIYAVVVDRAPIGVDTPADLEQLLSSIPPLA